MIAQVGCGTNNQEREATVCRIPNDFPEKSTEEITAQWKLVGHKQPCCEWILSPTHLGDRTKLSLGWQQRQWLCSPGRKGFVGTGKSSLRWLILWFTARQRRMQSGERTAAKDGESMVNRCRKSRSICTCSVVFQSLYFSHVEPLWWGIHWKPCKSRENQCGIISNIVYAAAD